MAVVVYSTFSRRKETLFPPGERALSIYVCGVTVYDLSHIGHARSAIAFDLIVRYLRYRGYDLVYVRNFTDVDDKIIKRSQELGVDTFELAQQMIDEYHRDMDAVGCLPPDLEPRVTETMDEIISLVQRIIDNGCGYVIDRDVYFSIRDFPGYGKLSGRSLSDMMDGARVEVDERLKDPKDFALWKSSKPGEPWWDSPWGRGRPGWHIECTAMNLKHHGVRTDIHGGGKDLIFPHHENEIAQAEAATGVKPWVRWWLHNGFVNVVKHGVEEKMSKSLGNFCTIREATEQVPAEVLRFLMICTHYRKDLSYGAEALLEAQRRLTYIYETLARTDEALNGRATWTDSPADASMVNAFVESMDDDFNVPAALGHISGLLKEMNELAAAGQGIGQQELATLSSLRGTLDELGRVLGVFQQEPAVFLAELRQRATAELTLRPEDIDALIQERARARKASDWPAADRIRDDLAARGILLKDGKDGTTWTVEKPAVA